MFARCAVTHKYAAWPAARRAVTEAAMQPNDAGNSR